MAATSRSSSPGQRHPGHRSTNRETAGDQKRADGAARARRRTLEVPAGMVTVPVAVPAGVAEETRVSVEFEDRVTVIPPSGR
jgi:hypothetical protein